MYVEGKTACGEGTPPTATTYDRFKRFLHEFKTYACDDGCDCGADQTPQSDYTDVDADAANGNSVVV